MIRGLRPLAFAGLGLACAALGLACAAPHPQDATPHTQAVAAARDATPQESPAVAPPGPLDGPAPSAREFTARGGLRVLVEAHPERLLAELSWEFAADERVESERLLLQYLLGLQQSVGPNAGGPPTGASTDGAVHFERCALARLCASLDRRQLERLLPAWLERTEPTREALERAKQATVRELARMESEPASSLDDLARAILDGSRGGPWGSQLVESWGEKQLRARLNAVLATARLRISGPLVPEAVVRRWAATAVATSAASSTPAAAVSTPTRAPAWLWLDVDRGARALAYVALSNESDELARERRASVLVERTAARVVRLTGPANELFEMLEGNALKGQPRLLMGGQAVLESGLPSGAQLMRLDPITHQTSPAAPLRSTAAEPSPEY